MSNAELNSQITPTAVKQSGSYSLAVVIPTLNRPHDLMIAVRTLLEQTKLPEELIIVDQSQSDESERQVRALFAERAKQAQQLRLRYTLDTRINSAATARNVALDQNSCDIVLFLDDDVELEPEFVEELMQGYSEDPEITGISGIITNYKPGGCAARTWQWLFVRGPFYDERQRCYHRADELRNAGRFAVSRFGGGLMSFRIDRIGGLRFDTNLRGASEGEDVDFCLRLPANARLEINPRARLIHKASVVARNDEHWIASVVRGNSYLYYRNWRRGCSNRIAFAWLMSGFVILALTASVKRASLKPWKAFITALQYGKAVGTAKK
jgi:GT2 family glycosyltransferase